MTLPGFSHVARYDARAGVLSRRPLFVELTKGVTAPRTEIYNSIQAPAAPGCRLRRFACPPSMLFPREVQSALDRHVCEIGSVRILCGEFF